MNESGAAAVDSLDVEDFWPKLKVGCGRLDGGFGSAETPKSDVFDDVEVEVDVGSMAPNLKLLNGVAAAGFV